MSSPRNAIAALPLTVLALIIAGCGGGSYSSSSPSESSTRGGASGGGSASSAGSSTISVAAAHGIGAVLVDSEGFTVYSFAKDRGTTSSCYGACAAAWPPVIVTGNPVSGKGTVSSQMGTTKRKDGTLQVTYAGHPLYTFIEDRKRGEANGNGSFAFGGEWSALDAGGTTVARTAAKMAEPNAPTKSGSRGGYGY